MLGDRIYRERTALGMSQLELADRAHVTPGYICQLEKNQKEPSVRVLRAILRALNLELTVSSPLAEEDRRC